MYRVGGGLEMGGRGRRLSVVAYAASPLMLGAFGGGRLPDLVLIALAPILLLPILRAAGVLADAGWRSVASGVAGLAIATSLAPWSIAFVAGAGVVAAAPCVASRKTPAGAFLRRAFAISGRS